MTYCPEPDTESATGRHSPTSEDAFQRLWEEMGFTLAGKPEDAAEYLMGVLQAVDETDGPPSSYNNAIGGRHGQQEFVFQCLRLLGLTSRSGLPRHGSLTPKGATY